MVPPESTSTVRCLPPARSSRPRTASGKVILLISKACPASSPASAERSTSASTLTSPTFVPRSRSGCRTGFCGLGVGLTLNPASLKRGSTSGPGRASCTASDARSAKVWPGSATSCHTRTPGVEAAAAPPPPPPASADSWTWMRTRTSSRGSWMQKLRLWPAAAPPIPALTANGSSGRSFKLATTPGSNGRPSPAAGKILRL
mmetsp:Transcript_19108/g.38912  ORF Transcript_19108/g.38912 Transcript_19108/m.38912 type:complete len:202 (+) Transcript_19108:234-839(+)